MSFTTLHTAPRLLMEAALEPVQGTRFQPTGFPDLGAATYVLPDSSGTSMLLLESAQSMANRLETVCWNEANDDLVSALSGLPYVRSTLPDGTVTSSIQEAHRLNSPYIVNSTEFEAIRDAVGFDKDRPFDRRKLASALFRYDPNSLVHGIFLEKIGGVVRLPRALSAFIEARNATEVASGGVKVDRVQPESSGDNAKYGKANEGYGNVPYHRDEYAAETITAYFNLDLALLRGFGLGQAAETLLIGLSLFKIQQFLASGLRLRTACDLRPKSDVVVKEPAGFTLPSLAELESALPGWIAEAKGLFVDPVITNVTYDKSLGKNARKKAGS